MNKSLYLTNEQYEAVLKRIREFIAKGEPLEFFDDTTIGDKDTQCSWGLCSRIEKYWPEAALHIWPETYPARIAPKYRQEGQPCPMDKRNGIDASWGCFYHCRVFQSKTPPSREETLKLYDLSLEKLKCSL